VRIGNTLAAILLLASTANAGAQDVATFYKNQRITMIVGYGPGGGYDIYARTLARHIGKYIPGTPNLIVQNMPGAASLRAANFLYNVAPKDGTVIGTFARNMPLLGLVKTNQNVQFDPQRFTWLGSSSSYANDAYVLIARKDATVKTIADLRDRKHAPLVLASTAEGGSGDVVPVVLRDLLELNLKTVVGYTDSSQINLAIERKEVDGRMVGYTAVKAAKPAWLAPDSPMHVLLAFGRADRFPEISDIPTARELARNDRDRSLIEVFELPYTLSRPFTAPPGVPADRAKALQQAFLAVHKDPQYLEDTGKLGLDVSPIGGEEVLRLIGKIAATPPDLMQAVNKYIAEGG